MKIIVTLQSVPKNLLCNTSFSVVTKAVFSSPVSIYSMLLWVLKLKTKYVTVASGSFDI